MRYLTIALVLALAGCTTTWIKPGATHADFNRDNYACERDSSGATYGNDLSGSLMRNQLYQDCMVSKGYTAK